MYLTELPYENGEHSLLHPVAAVANYRKLSGLKERTFIPFQFWGSGVWTGLTGPKGRGWQACHPCGAHFPAFSSLHFLALGPLLHLYSKQPSIFKILSDLDTDSPATLFHLQAPLWVLGPRWVIQENLIPRSADKQPEIPPTCCHVR